MKLISSEKIYISKSNIPKAGRGVFALKNITKGEVIEICPIIVFPRKDYLTIKKTIIRNYQFMWGKVTSALCFGFGSFYNHSYEANATYIKNIKNQTIEFRAIKKISKNEEIIINYNYGKPENKKKLWIKDIKPADEVEF